MGAAEREGALPLPCVAARWPVKPNTPNKTQELSCLTTALNPTSAAGKRAHPRLLKRKSQGQERLLENDSAVAIFANR